MHIIIYAPNVFQWHLSQQQYYANKSGLHSMGHMLYIMACGPQAWAHIYRENPLWP